MLFPLNFSSAINFSDNLKGTILLQVESRGEAWYVNPSDGKRYFMKDGVTAYQMMRNFGLGITNADLAKVPKDGEKNNYPKLVERLKGKILIQTENHGEAWYVRPKTGYRYYLKDGETAYNLMRYYSLGISDKDLEKISISVVNFEKTIDPGASAPPKEDTKNFGLTKKFNLNQNPYIIDGNYIKNYKFTYDWNDKNQGKEISITINAPVVLYNDYVNNKPHIFTSDFSNVTTYVTYNDIVIKDIANQISQLYKNTGMNPIVISQLLVNQIVYTNDISTGYDEYPKYPLETLLDGAGDCEDTAFLLSALLKALDPPFYSYLVLFKDHLAIAIVVPNDVYDEFIKNGMIDHMWENPYLNNGKLLFVETTGKKWKVGDMPTSLIGEKYMTYVIKY